MILLSCRNWQKKEETGRVTFSCIADFAASRPSRYSGVKVFTVGAVNDYFVVSAVLNQAFAVRKQLNNWE
jgi:hypothetical protein